MKLLDLSNIIAGVRKLGASKQTFLHLQESLQETIDGVIRGLSNNDQTHAILLWGCVNSGSGLNYVISAGAVYYQGEIYQVPAFTGTATGVNVPTLSLNTTYRAGDPVIYSDANSFNTHSIRQLVWTITASGGGLSDFNKMIPLFNFPLLAIGMGGKDTGAGGGAISIPSGNDLQLLPSQVANFHGGFFSVASGALNVPSGHPTGNLIDIYANAGSEAQIYIADDTSVWFQAKVGGTWLGWLQLYSPDVWLTAVTYSGSYVTGVIPLSYKKDGNRIEFKGNVQISGGIGTPVCGDTLFTLPVGFRPATFRTFPLVYTSTSPGANSYYGQLDSGGVFKVYQIGVAIGSNFTPSGAGPLFYMDGLRLVLS